jgi:ankyrin repeat protein
VLFFLNFGANPNEADSAGMTALNKLADTGRGFFTPDAQREIAELLISHAGKLETRAEAGFTPLHYATMKEHKSLIRQLVNAGADVNARNDYGWTAIDLAEDRGKYKDEELIALLRSLGGKRSIKEKDRKLLAAASGDVEAVKRLLAQGANFNFRDKHGETPLHRAAKFGGLETARLLITSGADVNAATMYGHTPLHDAAFWSHGTGVAELLVASGADIEARTGVGSTPLYEAVGWGNTQMVEFLIKAGADENAGNWRGETALHAAVEHGKKEVAAVLISYGADIAARDKKGRTPLDLAKKKRHTGIVKLLQDGR